MKEHSRPSVRLQDIAERAGVTKALISMALRNSPKVAVATRERIQALAKEMGYQSNPLLRTLMKEVRQRRKGSYRATLAFITNFDTEERWREFAVYPDYFAGAQQGAAALGYELEHFWLGHYCSQPSRLLDVLHARGIPGALIAPLPAGRQRFDLNLSGISAVTFGYSLRTPNLPRVSNNHVQTVQLAIGKLYEMGYRRVGFTILEQELRQVNYLWQAGLVVAQHCFPDMEILTHCTPLWSEATFRDWFTAHRPEAILSPRIIVLQWLENLGLAVPDEVGFLHLDCPWGNAASGTFQNTFHLGSAAVQMLANFVEGNITLEAEKPQIMMLPSEFNEGTTLRWHS